MNIVEELLAENQERMAKVKPTLTIVTGDPKSGRTLVATALGLHIVGVVGKRALVVHDHESERALENIEGNPQDDVLLVSGSDVREPWMDEWVRRFGEPLFSIHITRNA
jgi:hypothetical protein